MMGSFIECVVVRVIMNPADAIGMRVAARHSIGNPAVIVLRT